MGKSKKRAKRKKFNEDMNKFSLGCLIPMLFLFITAIATGFLYGNATVYLGGSIIPGANIDLFIVVIILGSGVISIIIAYITKMVFNKKKKK